MYDDKDDVENTRRHFSFADDPDDETFRKMSFGFEDALSSLDDPRCIIDDDEDMNMFQNLSSTAPVLENIEKETEDKVRQAETVKRYVEKRKNRKKKKKSPSKKASTKRKSKVATSPIAKQAVSSPADKLDAEERKKFEAWKKEFLKEQRRQQRKVMHEIRKKEKEKIRDSRHNRRNRPLIKLVCAGSSNSGGGAVLPASPIVHTSDKSSS